MTNQEHMTAEQYFELKMMKVFCKNGMAGVPDRAVPIIIQGLKSYAAQNVTEFSEAILHGDYSHRRWLKDSALHFNSGAPLPPLLSKDD